MRWLGARPILVLLLGSAPLAALTVASFARIGQVSQELPATDGFSRSKELALLPPDRLAGDEALARALAECELFAGGSLGASDESPEPVFFTSLRRDWGRWCGVEGLVDDVLRFEQRVAQADRRGLEQAAEEVRRLLNASGKQGPAHDSRLVRALERREREIQDRIRRLRDIESAKRLMIDAGAAADRQEHERAIEIYDEIFAKFSSVLEPAELADLRARREDAQFRRDGRALFNQVQSAGDVARKRSLLKDFLAKYANPVYRSTAAIEQAQAQLLAVEAEALRLERNRAAERPIEMLAGYDIEPFPDGLRAAAEIAKTYPTDTVRARLQDRVRTWLVQALPAKELMEPVDLEEAELADGQVLRGYFAATRDPGGRINGYKCYKSAEERKSPTAAVGRYAAAEFRRRPGVTVLRDCVLRYAEARRTALTQPDRQVHWTALAATCETLDAELSAYRRLPDSSREPLSFESEGRLARALLNPVPWSQIEEGWAK